MKFFLQPALAIVFVTFNSLATATDARTTLALSMELEKNESIAGDGEQPLTLKSRADIAPRSFWTY